MRYFANMFLILFCADGMLSLMDEICALAFSLHVFSGVRGILANFVIVMAIPLYLCLGIDKRLPKSVLIPLILFVLLCPISVLMFPSLAGSTGYGLSMAALQVLLCVLPISRFRKDGAKSLVMAKTMFDAPFFSLRNSAAFFAANLFAVPLAIALFVFCAANSYLSLNTAGFMHLAPDGLHMVEKVYSRDNKTIRLAAMIHVGEKEYYEKLSDTAIAGRTIVLAEGVTDSGHLLNGGIDYSKLAGVLGLTSQENMRLKGRLIDKVEMEEAESAKNDDAENDAEADILRADVDISSFRPNTILILNELSRSLKESPSLSKGLTGFNAWLGKNMTPAMYKDLMDDILHRRNSVLIGHLRNALLRYDTIVIPWGAMHMPEIEREVLQQGFRRHKDYDRISIDFRKKLRDAL